MRLISKYGTKLAALVLAGAGIAACSSNTPGATNTTSAGSPSSAGNPSTTLIQAPRGLQAVQLAAVTLGKVKTYHMTLNGTMTMSLSSAMNISVTLSGSGDENIQTHMAAMNLSETSSFSSAMSLTINEIIDGSNVYLGSSIFKDLPMVTKPWIEMNSAANTTSTAFENALTDPTELLTFLSKVGSVTTVGQATVGGVSTTEYTADVDISKAAAIEGASQDMISAMQCIGTTNFPMNIWIDSSGYTRQIQFNWVISDLSGANSKATMSMTVGFSNFGEAVSVSVPPASEVQNYSSLGYGSGTAGSCPTKAG